MEIHTATLEPVLEWLQKQATACQAPLIVQARIVVSPREARLLAIQPEDLLETINY